MLTALPFLTVYSGLTLALSWHDLRRGLLPDSLTAPLLWCGLLFYLCLFPLDLAQAVWGAIGGYLSFAGLYWSYRGLRGREGLGYGDVKYLAALGAWHGWQALPNLVLIAALLACATAGVIAIVGKSRLALNNPLPFGPFLTTAGFICGWQTLISQPP